jgi:beta-glucanase (GH16 family)
MSGSGRLIAAGVGVVMVLAAPGCSSSASANSSSSSPATSANDASTAKWKTVWSEYFNGRAGTGVNTKYWRYNTGQGVFGTGEVEAMTNSSSNVHLDGKGHLDITALGQGAAGTTATQWTSGRLQTKALFGAPAGGEMMISASIKQPDPANGVGYWPGFWMLGPGQWPATGEIDIMEDVDGISNESATLHCGNLTQGNSDGTTGPCHEGTGLTSGLRPCSACQTAFHTYSVIVDRRNANDEQVRWYLDGREFFSVSESKIGQAVWSAAVDHGYSILLSLAVGGSFPNDRCGCTSPTAKTSSQGTMVVRDITVATN